MSANEDRVRAAYWLAFSETMVDEEDRRLLAAENRAHEAAMDAGFPDDFDAAKRVALAVLAVADAALAVASPVPEGPQYFFFFSGEDR